MVNTRHRGSTNSRCQRGSSQRRIPRQRRRNRRTMRKRGIVSKRYCSHKSRGGQNVTIFNVHAGHNGEYITVDCTENCTVAELKKNIYKSNQIQPYCQQILGRDSKTLSDDYKLTPKDSKGLLLITKKPSELWQPSNGFIIDNETATWKKQPFNDSHDAYNNCIWMTPLPRHSKHQMSFRLNYTAGYGGHMCGLIPSEIEGDGGTFDKEQGWFLQTYKRSDGGKGDARLVGHPTDQTGDETIELAYDKQHQDWGTMNNRNVITMEADLDNHTLKFWFNGNRVGRYFNNVPLNVKWAASVYWNESAVEVVATPPNLPK